MPSSRSRASKTVTSDSTGPQVGDRAPKFRLPDATGKVCSLEEFLGRPVILYFYPEADTPACTTQACDFDRALQRGGPLEQSGASVIGISPDPVERLAEFARRHALRFTLLSDRPSIDGTPRTMAAYGAWGAKSLYGRTYTGVIRSTYILDPRGRVAARFMNVRANGHADRVVKAFGEKIQK